MVYKSKQKSEKLYREMDYLQDVPVETVENDALVRFYAMLNIVVNFKGRPTYEVEKAVMDIKIKQPLVSAFYKMFQAMLNYPSNKPISELVHYTCHEVLFHEVEKVQIQLGLKSDTDPSLNTGKVSARQEALTLYQKRAHESRMRIYEDTIRRFYSLLDLYTPYKLRPRLWEEQSITEEQWNFKIKQPIREAFKSFILVMRQFPTKINKQKELVAYTLHTILPNCEAAMLERGLRFELSLPPKFVRTKCKPKGSPRRSPSSVWNPDDDDIKIAMGYQSNALRLPSHTPEAQLAMNKYEEILKKARHSVSIDVTRLTEPRRQSSIKSLLQKVSTDVPDQRESKGFAWVKTDGYRVINKNDFELATRPHTSMDTDRSDKKATASGRESRVTYLNTAQSSSTLVTSDDESEKIISTNAISYRPVLSAKQKAVMKKGADTNRDAVYECFSRSSTGYPVIHSKRRRGAKSASAWGRPPVTSL